MVELPTIIAIILGAIASGLTELIKQLFKQRLARLAVAVFFSVISGALSFYLTPHGHLDIAESIALVFAYSQLTYQFFKGAWALAEKKNLN